MLAVPSALLVAGFAFVPGVVGHGYVSSIVLDGEEYTGWLASEYPHVPDPPETIAWSTTVTDNGFVAPDAFGSSDVACHRGGAPSAISGSVAAGGTVEFEWNTWPESHSGPIINYLAKVDDFGSAEPGSLQFFKFDEAGYDGGSWATDALLSNGLKSSATIPSSIEPGNYVLRHEIIALHSAGNEGGAQSYPQCVNIEVTGGGGANPGGTPATSFYTPSDPGILFDIYTGFDSYPIPGPELFTG